MPFFWHTTVTIQNLLHAPYHNTKHVHIPLGTANINAYVQYISLPGCELDKPSLCDGQMNKCTFREPQIQQLSFQMKKMVLLLSFFTLYVASHILLRLSHIAFCVLALQETKSVKIVQKFWSKYRITQTNHQFLVGIRVL